MDRENAFVNSLLSQMTIREKIGQLTMVVSGLACYDRQGGTFSFRPALKKQLEEYGIGIVSTLLRADPWSQRTYGNGVELEQREEFVNQFQRYVVQHSRLGIPALLDLEASHGMQALGSVMYPCNIGMGCSFDPELYGRMMALIAEELKLSGNHIGFISLMDIARDPRWGRTEECFGEDPLLSSRMTERAVRSFDRAGVSICVKHYLGHGGAAGGHMAGAVCMGPREMREIHLPPARAAVRAGAEMFMVAYNDIDGIPCVVNRRLLTEILREELGFDGVIMSDGGGVAMAKSLCVNGEDAEAAALALNAGIDVSLGDNHGVFLALEEALYRGMISQERLDEAVERVLRLKVKHGLFDDPYLKPGRVAAFVQSGVCQQMAYEAAAASMVLLKNQGGVLPLKPSQKIALIGPQAESVYHLLGDYTSPRKTGEMKTLRQAMEERFDRVTTVCGYAFEGGEDGFAPALEAVRNADVAVLLMGGSSVRDFDTLFNEAGTVVGGGSAFMDCGEGVDVSSLDLPGSQLALLAQITATGKPTVVVLLQGRPYALRQASEQADAILAAWYPGQMGAQAVADALLGAIQPCGRLSISIPRGAQYLPVAYNMYASTRRPYADGLSGTIYPFGYGLSYMPRRYSNLRVEGGHSMEELENGASFAVRVDVENLGDATIREVVCLYFTAKGQPVLRRGRELVDFRRVELLPGQKRTVDFAVGKEALSYLDQDGRRKLGPGRFVLSAGVNPDQEMQVEIDLNALEGGTAR